MTTTTPARPIPPGRYRCVCGIEMSLDRVDLTALSCGCGRSYDAETIGDAAHGPTRCGSCGIHWTGSARDVCPGCQTGRRGPVDPFANGDQAPAVEVAPAPGRPRPILPSDAYLCACGAHIRAIARTDRVTCDGCGRVYVGADVLGDPTFGRWTCRCGSTGDDLPEGRPGSPCHACGAERRPAVDPWPGGVDPDSGPYAAFTGDLLTEAEPGACARAGCTVEADPDESGYCSTAHWVADAPTRRDARRGGIIEQTNEGD